MAQGSCTVFDGPHPRIPTRASAAKAIEATAEFQHKTKLSFEIGQEESAIAGCHNFEFAPEHVTTFRHYLETGVMEFSPKGGLRGPPFTETSEGSIGLTDAGFLVDHIELCESRPLTETTGAYELTLGKPIVEVTGIRKQGSRALVDFRWHFESLNEVGRSLPRVQTAREQQTSDERLTAGEKSLAPFWTGLAEFASYDDGWRVEKIEFRSGKLSDFRWEYGPAWPDPSFNWNAFDESQNRY